MIQGINFEKIKKLIGKMKLQDFSRNTGFASIDRPWDKFNAKIEIDDIDCYQYLLRRLKFNSMDKISLCHEEALSLDELTLKSEKYAKAFLAMGIKKGDIVPICMHPCNEALIMFFALVRIGAATTYLNASSNVNELKKYIETFNSKAIVMSNKILAGVTDVLDTECLNKVITVAPNKPIMGQNISNLTKEYLETYDVPEVNHEKVLNLEEFTKMGEGIELNVKTSKDDIALITYTSGSTGEPKAIDLTNENIMAEIESLKKTTFMQFGKKGNALQVVPFNYPYGFVISTLLPIYVGKTVALTPSLTLKNIPEYIKMYKPTYMQAIPSFYKEIMNNPETQNMNFSFSKYQVSGGDTFDINAKKSMDRFNKIHHSTAKICDGSGMAEGGACLTTAVIVGKPNYYSVGKPIVGLNVKIVDPDTDEELQYGKVGKFCFTGKNLMLGYHNDPEATNRAIHVDKNGVRWFYSDTYAHMDEKGYLYIDGRDRRFFITYDEAGSPYKVYCDYVQSIITRHPDVLDCAVVKKPDDLRSFIPKAYVVLRNGANLDDIIPEIIKICKTELQNCAIPVEFDQIAAIPLNRADKIDYPSLERKSVEEYESAIADNKIRNM